MLQRPDMLFDDSFNSRSRAVSLLIVLLRQNALYAFDLPGLLILKLIKEITCYGLFLEGDEII